MNYSLVTQKIIAIAFVYILTVTTSHSWNPNDYYDDDTQYPQQFPYQTQPTFELPKIEFPKNHRPQCNCIKLKECRPLMWKLYTAPKPLPSNLSKDIRKSGCGYAGIEPLVCCPQIEERTKTTEKPWVWDSVEQTESNKPENLANRLNIDEVNWSYYNYFQPPFPGQKNFNEKTFFTRKTKRIYFFEFEDPRTFRNCPPSFSHDFRIPSHFQNVKPIRNFHPMNNPADENDSNHINNVINPIPNPNHVNNGPRIVFNDMAARPTSSFPKRVGKIPLDKLKLINSRNCGISIDAKIIGGDDAAPNQFPWMARLAYRNRTSQLVSYRCSGTVISEQYVLTAAHCVTNLVDDLEVVYVRLGELDSRTNLCDTNGICDEPQDYEIESIVQHPNYDTPKYANDIAIIRLRRTTNSSSISPLCLPIGAYERSDHNLNGELGIIAGWGVSTAGGMTSNPMLQYVRLPIVDTHSCAESYARFSANSRTPIIINDHQVCVQGTANRDACQGDSGGPLMREDKSNGRFTLVGLVSFGPRTCGVSNFPGVYTRVSAYIDWIARNIRL